MGNDKQVPDDDTQMAIESSGADAVGTAQDPEKRPEPVSDGDAIAGNPHGASPAEPDLPEEAGPDAVPPGNSAGNEYDKE